MPLWLAVVILALAVGGMVLSGKLLQEKRKVRTVLLVLLALVALLCVVYIGLTLLFVAAAENQPPTA